MFTSSREKYLVYLKISFYSIMKIRFKKSREENSNISRRKKIASFFPFLKRRLQSDKYVESLTDGKNVIWLRLSKMALQKGVARYHIKFIDTLKFIRYLEFLNILRVLTQFHFQDNFFLFLFFFILIKSRNEIICVFKIKKRT